LAEEKGQTLREFTEKSIRERLRECIWHQFAWRVSVIVFAQQSAFRRSGIQSIKSRRPFDFPRVEKRHTFVAGNIFI
jgi:hypothetical protein